MEGWWIILQESQSEFDYYYAISTVPPVVIAQVVLGPGNIL